MNKILCVMFALMVSVFIFVGCGSASQVLVVMPDGAPALSMLGLMSKDYKINGESTEYRIVSSDNIAGLVANRQADVAVLPLNLASKVCGEDYQILSVMTFGNLYLVSNAGASVQDVIGHNLYVINLNNVPGLTTKIMLNELNIPYSESSQTQDNTMLIGATAQELIGGFMSGKVEYAVVAEPAVSLMLSQVEGLEVIGDVQDIMGEYPQSVLVIKKNVFDAEEIGYLIEELQNIVMFAHSNVTKIYDIIESHLQEGVVTSFKENLITRDLITRCNIGFKLAVDEKQNIDNYIDALREINENSTNLIPPEAYYDIAD